MKKKILATILSIGLVLGMCSCGNQDMLDTTYTFDRAIIKLPNGEIVEGRVESWTDMYDYPTQMQIKIDGVTYLTDISNVVLITEQEGFVC